MESIEKIQDILARAPLGTVNYHRNGLYPFVYTDGVKAIAEAAECWWLMDIIWSYQPSPVLTRNESAQQSQYWRIEAADSRAVVTCSEGNEVLISQEIEYTDFPLPELDLVLVGMGYRSEQPAVLALVLED